MDSSDVTIERFEQEMSAAAPVAHKLLVVGGNGFIGDTDIKVQRSYIFTMTTVQALQYVGLLWRVAWR